MRATLLKDTIKSLFPIQRTISIEGAPGGGKTTIVHEAAKEMDVPVIEKHMPTMLVEDFGILFPDNSSGNAQSLHYKLPDWFPVKGKAPEQGILLFDDRNQAGADYRKYWQTSVKHGLYMVYLCLMGGWWYPLATDSLTEPVQTECSPSCVIVRQCLSLRLTWMTAHSG
jgi:hypothetical protein